MNKEELIDFLKENLRITIECGIERWRFGDDPYVKVSLILDGNEISTECDTIRI